MDIEGRLGGSLHLLTMAEMLRRTAEQVHNTLLPEEDMQGFGYFRPGVKKRLYGFDRLLDGGKERGRQFLRQIGFDYGVRVRWYVEGYTEYGALCSIFEDNGPTDVQIINLHAQFIEGKGKDKVVSFINSLEADIRAGIFSWITLDRDKDNKTSEDIIRAIRQAAKEDRMFGMFYISDPDFEFGNFDLDELEEILWNGIPHYSDNSEFITQLSLHKTILDAVTRLSLHKAIKGAKSGKELFSRLHTLPAFHGQDKGIKWGKQLMDYAIDHPVRSSTGIIRPIVEAVQLARAADVFNYSLNKTERKMDPSTGRQIDR